MLEFDGRNGEIHRFAAMATLATQTFGRTMAYDAGLVQRVADALDQIGERAVRQKNVFSGWGFLIGKSTFVIVWNDALLVKTTPDEYPALLAQPGIEPFAPGDERPMGTWLVVPADVVAEDPELIDWVRRGLRGIRR